MYFKRLEIFGFKSFAEKTTLNFEPGITAIVGPNGCGKSNIFDSIRWVLGEQSVKELRGSSMEDVIFNGTDKRSSLGFAEVSLTFSNESKVLPIEYDEVTVTRRLFRSGESEYLLNKIVVRLRDIQELFMGTGVGAEAYSLIQQGKVDLIVSARPEERRMIFDEASGITKYKTKKKEALSKLKDTENNLLRVNDIVIEVKRQIASIERQANKARKYKEEFENLKSMEIKLAHKQLRSFGGERNKIQGLLEELSGKELTIAKELEEFSNLIEHETNYLEELEQKIGDLQSDEIKLEGQIDVNNRQIGFNHERIQSLKESIERYRAQKDQLIERCRIQQEKIEDIKKTLKTIEETIHLGEQTLKDKKDSLRLMGKLIEEAKAKISEHEIKILNLTSNQVSIRNLLTDIMKEVQGALARKRRLEMETDKVTSEKNEVDQKLTNIDSQLISLREFVSQKRETKEKNNKILSDLNFDLANLDGTIQELDKKILFLNSQKEFIEKLNVQYQDIPDPIIEGRFIAQSQPLEHHTGVIGKVKGVIPVEGDQLTLLQNRFGQAGKQLYEIVCETKFIELDPQQVTHKINEINREREIALSHKESLVIKVLQQKDVLQQIEEEIQIKEKSLSILEAQKSDILGENQKLLGELALVDSELSEVREFLSTIKKKEDEYNYQLDTLNQEMSWCQNDIKDKQTWISVKSQEKEGLSISIAQLEAEITSDREKHKSQQETQTLLAESLDNWLGEIKTMDDEVAGHLVKIEQYEKDNESITVTIDQIKQQKESLKSILNDYNVQKSEVTQRLNSVRSNIRALEEESVRVKQDIHEQRMNEQKLSFSEQTLKDRLIQAYKVNLEEVLQALEDTQAAQEINSEELNIEIERLRKKCESFGSVNLVAIEEFEELKKRFEFLTTQQSDLLEAKSQLMNTITKINRSTRQMFMDTFTKVSEEFRIYFRMLFGGGEADLVLLDPENVLESGIEIVARPPGKKLQSISLLSGGEKSLTAIALIFGVFKVNPSPFCVLDEIDAALDESNVGRFSYLLKDFARVAQFIVITHNKKTIASSDVMYGITMPETGVSRIVSVKFGDDAKEKKAVEEIPAGV